MSYELIGNGEQLLKWSNTAVTNDVKYSNIEFFHTSSYYDALNG